jgi:hypothetical protein
MLRILIRLSSSIISNWIIINSVNFKLCTYPKVVVLVQQTRTRESLHESTREGSLSSICYSVIRNVVHASPQRNTDDKNNRLTQKCRLLSNHSCRTTSSRLKISPMKRCMAQISIVSIFCQWLTVIRNFYDDDNLCYLLMRCYHEDNCHCEETQVPQMHT